MSRKPLPSPPRAADLVRIGELVKLAAQTAIALGNSATDGKHSTVLDCARRIEATADELIQIGLDLQTGTPGSL